MLKIVIRFEVRLSLKVRCDSATSRAGVVWLLFLLRSRLHLPPGLPIYRYNSNAPLVTWPVRPSVFLPLRARAVSLVTAVEGQKLKAVYTIVLRNDARYYTHLHFTCDAGRALDMTIITIT